MNSFYFLFLYFYPLYTIFFCKNLLCMTLAFDLIQSTLLLHQETCFFIMVCVIISALKSYQSIVYGNSI